MSIALNHITLSYGSRTLLEDVTAAFAQGSLTALIGRNGTGKSTLLRAIAGLGTTVSGDVALCGRPLASLTPHELSTTVGFVTTDKVRIANLACEDVVALGRAPYTNWIGRMQEADRAVVERSLRLVGMSAFARKTMDRMSDGECQRVMIARALAHPAAREWFAGGWERVRNENEIIIPGRGSTRRPDRVMIDGRRVVVVDYKFGLRDAERHRRQMREYLRLLGEMGYAPAEGYLWYVKLGKIEKVEP